MAWKAFFLIVVGCLTYNYGAELGSSNLEARLNLEHVCDDYIEIPLSAVVFPPHAHQYLTAIKHRRGATVYYSPTMVRNWDKVAQFDVQGMNASVATVFEFFRDISCFVFPWGGSVRDLVLGHFVADIDAEITCNPYRLWSNCKKRFGVKNCQRHRRGNANLTLGTYDAPTYGKTTVLPLDLALFNVTFGSRKTALEYTADALSYFPEARLLIDISGTALEDICAGKIRIPAKREYWSQWRGNNTIDKLLRYWRLRSKGFVPADDEVKLFVFRELTHNFIPHEAQQFTCHKFFNGRLDRHGICRVFAQDDEDERKAKLEQFLDTLQKDFGAENVKAELPELFRPPKIVYKVNRDQTKD